MQFAPFLFRQLSAACTLAIFSVGALRVTVAASVLITILVGPLRLGLQECAGAEPIAGIRRRRQQQRTHRSNQEQHFHKGTCRSTPRLGIVSLIIDVPVRVA
jgi:hypothetical protein